MTEPSREAFEKWAVGILGDNPNWCESGDCELAWQSWRASRETEQAQAVEPVATVQCINGVTIGYLDAMQPVGTKLYTHPATPVEQAQSVEPVAWMHPSRDPHLLSHSSYTYGSASVPLYLHPAPTPAEAQQVAVPMTEAQIFECDPVPHVMFDQQRIDFARAIEAFHGIGAKPEAGIPVSETKVRPQNCGTGYCSCIECPYPKADWSAA